jgi:integrase
MAKRPPYLTRIGNRWYFYRRIPDDVRAGMSTETGEPAPTFWKRTLKTDSLREAARLVGAHADETEAIIARRRGAYPDLQTLLRHYGLNVEPAAMTNSDLADLVFLAREEAKLGVMRAKLEAAQKTQTVAATIGTDDANTLLRQGSIGTEYEAARAPHEATEKAVEAVRRTWAGIATPEPSKATPSASNGLSWALATWQARNKPAGRTYDEAAVAVRHFVELHGDLPLSQITTEHVRAFRAAMLAIPKHMRKEDASRPLPEILERFEGKDVPRVSAVSAKKRLSFIRSLLRTAVDEGAIPTNPADGVTVRAPLSEEDRMPFSEADLRRMFTSPPFEPMDRGDDYYFVLLSLFSGARAGELVQLRKTDLHAENGIPYFRIDRTNGKTTKTKSSIRRIPVHPALVERGFLDWAKRGPDRVFDGIPVGKAQVSDPASKRFNRWLDEIGITDKALTLHSTRHSFKTWARAAGITEEVSDALSGHAATSVARRYGLMPLDVLAEAMNRIKCPVTLPG